MFANQARFFQSRLRLGNSIFRALARQYRPRNRPPLRRPRVGCRRPIGWACSLCPRPARLIEPPRSETPKSPNFGVACVVRVRLRMGLNHPIPCLKRAPNVGKGDL